MEAGGRKKKKEKQPPRLEGQLVRNQDQNQEESKQAVQIMKLTDLTGQYI